LRFLACGMNHYTRHQSFLIFDIDASFINYNVYIIDDCVATYQ